MIHEWSKGCEPTVATVDNTPADIEAQFEAWRREWGNDQTIAEIAEYTTFYDATPLPMQRKVTFE